MNKALAEDLYRIAKEWVATEWAEELDRFRRLGRDTLERMSASEFLAKYCWVVYASGFKASAIKGVFPGLREVYRDFDLDSVADLESLDAVLEVFANRRKAEGFVRGARLIREEGFESFKSRLLAEGMDALVDLPGIGPVTKKHLARNIGLADVVKDDVWLVRVADVVGAPSAAALGEHLSATYGDGPGTVDYVFWKFCTESGWKELEDDTLEEFVGKLKSNNHTEPAACPTSRWT